MLLVIPLWFNCLEVPAKELWNFQTTINFLHNLIFFTLMFYVLPEKTQSSTYLWDLFCFVFLLSKKILGNFKNICILARNHGYRIKMILIGDWLEWNNTKSSDISPLTNWRIKGWSLNLVLCPYSNTWISRHWICFYMKA